VSEEEAGFDAPEAGSTDPVAAWQEVAAGLDALGDAIARWAKAAVNDPDNRRRADELASRLDGFMSEAASTVKGAADSELGQSFREAADKTGEALRQAGEKVTDELGPRLSGAFKSAAERLGHVAERMEERAGREAADGVDTDTPPDGQIGGTGGQ
jgi:predicted transcriptional regulator